MSRIAIGVLICVLGAPALSAAQTCTPPAAGGLSPNDSSLSDWMSGSLCMWQGTDSTTDQSRDGSNILGFSVTHSPTIGSDTTLNHFWFIRLEGEPLDNRTYRMTFQKAGTRVDMDMSCPESGQSPQTCSIECFLNGQQMQCALTNVRAYSWNGSWVIELARHSTQLFFDSTDNSSITASVLRNSTVEDTTTA
ncbi:MAG: hypothetical protein HY901_16080, partial [Deltaproteobacteria bacterium]|nr:hypothetical protein [Deltaproteobacteria bacterium]